jgi:hypothetical protein
VGVSLAVVFVAPMIGVCVETSWLEGLGSTVAFEPPRKTTGLVAELNVVGMSSTGLQSGTDEPVFPGVEIAVVEAAVESIESSKPLEVLFTRLESAPEDVEFVLAFDVAGRQSSLQESTSLLDESGADEIE